MVRTRKKTQVAKGVIEQGDATEGDEGDDVPGYE